MSAVEVRQDEVKQEARNRAFHELRKLAEKRPDFKQAMESIGFFTAMDLIEIIVDASHPREILTVSDGMGSEWPMCQRDDCGLEVVRPGRVQCVAEGCDR